MSVTFPKSLTSADLFQRVCLSAHQLYQSVLATSFAVATPKAGQGTKLSAHKVHRGLGSWVYGRGVEGTAVHDLYLSFKEAQTTASS